MRARDGVRGPLRNARDLIAGLVLAVCAGTAWAGAPLPPTGQYRVDSESTKVMTAGPNTLEVFGRVDGRTGDETATQRAMPGGQSHTTKTPGTGPVLNCVQHGALPAHLPAAMAGSAMPCSRMVVNGQSAAYTCEGNGLRQEVQWRHLDDKTWEVRTLVKSSSVGAPPPAGTAAASPELLAAMDAEIRSTKGEELAALKRAREQAAGRGAAGPALPPTTVVQRYTRIADRCDAVR